MKTKALAREDRHRQIYQCFAIELQEGRNGELTVSDVAHKLHLSPSTKLRIMLEELVMEGGLQSRKEDIPGIAKFRRIYSPDPKHFKRPTPQYKGAGRTIKINAKQMSIFAEVS